MTDVEFRGTGPWASCLQLPSSFDPRSKGNQEIVIPEINYDKS